MMSRNTLSIPALLLLLASTWLWSGNLPLPAQSQDSTSNRSLRAVLSEPLITFGESTTLTIHTGEELTAPKSIAVENLTISYQQSISSVHTRMINGHLAQTNSYQYVYKITPQKAGKFTIPKTEIKNSNEIFSFGPIQITVEESDNLKPSNKQPPRYAFIKAPKDVIYEREIFPISVVVLNQGRNSIQKVLGISLEANSFAMNRFTEMTLGTELIDGVHYCTATLPSQAYAFSPGRHLIESAKIDISIPSHTNINSIFSTYKTVEVRAESLQLNITPLPDNRPKSFCGGVGKFNLTVSLAGDAPMKAGEPIKFTHTITGDGNFDFLECPKLVDPDNWLVIETLRTKEADGPCVFELTLIPQLAIRSLPSFDFTYFDPAASSYQTIRAQPVANDAGDIEYMSANQDAMGSSDAPSKSRLEAIINAFGSRIEEMPF